MKISNSFLTLQYREADYVHVTNTKDRNNAQSATLARPAKATHQLDLTQSAESSRENCKRARASGPPVSPEESVAALSLNEVEEPPAPDIRAVVNLRLAGLLLSRGKPQDALVALETIISANVSDADALCLQGKCYFSQSCNVQVSSSCESYALPSGQGS